MNSERPPLALAGVRVLDFTRLLPGPFCTLALADLGADVIRVEDPSGGDWVRALPPFVDGMGAAFHALNRGKKSIAVDLKTERGRAIAAALAADADVLVEGFRPGVMAKFGLDHATLRAASPHLIYCSISGFGATGPLAHRAGHDLTYESVAGILNWSGGAAGSPVVPPIPLADMAGAISAAFSIVSSLLVRQRSQQGCFLDISMTDSTLALAAIHLAPWLAGAAPPTAATTQLTGNESNYNIYETSDGQFLAVAPLEPKFVEAFARAMRDESLGSKLMSATVNPKEHDVLRTDLARRFKQKTLAQWLAVFENVDACVEPIAREWAPHPQFRERDLFHEYATGQGTLMKALSFVPNNLMDRRGALKGAPRLGEHTRSILADLGIQPSEVDALAAQGIVACC